MSNANEPDRINTGALATTIGIVALSTLGIALFVTSLVREETKVLGDARQGTQDRGLRDLRADQLGVLEAAPSWKDRAAGVVTLPIARAMDWMVEAVRKDPKALSPWHPPEAMGGAGPEDSQAGSGGASAGPSADERKQPAVEKPAPGATGSAPAAPVPPPSPAVPAGATPAAP